MLSRFSEVCQGIRYRSQSETDLWVNDAKSSNPSQPNRKQSSMKSSSNASQWTELPLLPVEAL